MSEHQNKGLEEFCNALCMGQPDAMKFCQLWFDYCHAIDDLIDNMEDGRATTHPEEILRLFGLAAVIYNGKFYVAHREMLFPMVLSITNAYADSVAWERSPVNRQRKIADVLRCCGNEMFFTVASIIGGWKHMRTISPAIRDRSWVLQHDSNDQPN